VISSVNVLNTAISRMPAQYHEMPGWEALLARSWALSLQQTENDVKAIEAQLDWRTAEGDWLDLWGHLVALERPAESDYQGESGDTLFRQAIHAQMLRWSGNGSGADIVTAATRLLPGVDVALKVFTGLPPRVTQLDLYTSLTPAQRGIAAHVLHAMAPVGSRLIVVEDAGLGWGFTLEREDLGMALRRRVQGDYRTSDQWVLPDYFRRGILSIGLMGGS
jgi:hypothetical protein